MINRFFSFLFIAIIIANYSCGQSAQQPSNSAPTFGKIQKPMHWDHALKDLGNGLYELVITGNLDDGWHTYSKDMSKDVTPLPGAVTFTPNKDYKLDGPLKEIGDKLQVDEPVLKEHYIELKKKLVLTQKLQSLSPEATVKVSVDYQICNEVNCLPSAPYEFEVKLTGNKQDIQQQIKPAKNDTGGKTMVVPTDTNKPLASSIPAKEGAIKNSVLSVKDFNHQFLRKEPASGWVIFWGGFLGGLLAILTPCVYAMIPLNVSFFTKHTGSKQKGIMTAITYGLSIIVIYVALGFIVTKLFGSDALNDLASNVYFNMAFFIIFIIFAISFFGAFEIVLPNSWINKSENLSEKGGIVGIFFMAFTLALVSFSCTGPIIGTLLVQAAVGGNSVGPLLGMFGFSLALAFPFVLFSLFPGWLQSLPKSGGWLNAVKVVFGFLEVALALKFLSVVDLAYHWRILDREVFLSLWIVISLLLGIYLMGGIKFAHDSEIHYISIPRLFFAIISFSFAIYMVPGLWGAPLKAISAFSPPEFTQDFDLVKATSDIQNAITDTSKFTARKYDNIFHTPYGIKGYFDYNEGITAARKQKKPIMLDFTGWSCFNCRKMEVSVWSDPQVLSRMKNDYVLISMYVDDKTELPEKEQFVSTYSGKKIRTLGNWYSDIEASMYETNTQPFYVLLDNDGKILNMPRSYNQDIKAYVDWLDDGLAQYKKRSLAVK